MNMINLNFVFGHAVNFFKEATVNSLTNLQKRILVIALIALGCLALCYSMSNYCFAKQQVHGDAIDNANQYTTLQPEIISDQWGEIILEFNGEEKAFRDVVVLPSHEPVEWNWKWQKNDKDQNVGMSHVPGVRIVDVEHYILSQLDEQPDVIILTQGRGHGGQRENPGPGILQVESDVKAYLQEKGIKVYILKTAEAIEKYQQLRLEGKQRIAAMIHTTC